jgi:hypothetical protein
MPENRDEENKKRNKLALIIGFPTQVSGHFWRYPDQVQRVFISGCHYLSNHP